MDDKVKIVDGVENADCAGIADTDVKRKRREYRPATDEGVFAPIYNGERKPPHDGMKLYLCLYAAELAGPPLVDRLVNLLSRGGTKAFEEAVEILQQEALCCPDEADRLADHISAEIEENGVDEARERPYPFMIRQVRWAYPADVPDDPRFQELDLHLIEDRAGAEQFINANGGSVGE